MTRSFKLIFFISYLGMIASFAEIPYKVEYLGIDDSTALKTIKSTTQISTLQKKLPDSLYALRYRAESDIPTILKILQAHGYYDATVRIQVEESSGGAVVKVKVQLGPPYRISSFNICLFQGDKDHCICCPSLDSTSLGLSINAPIQAIDVINAELKALQRLSECGYPLASVVNRSIVADGDTKTVSIQLDIDTGPLAYFGPVTIEGSETIKPRFFQEKMNWKEGDIYSGKEVEDAQKALMDSGLFSSVSLTHEEPIQENGYLPLHLEIAESKHKSIYGGVSYQTYYGPGLTFGWENRNMAGLGRRFSIQGDVTKRSHSGLASYLVPNSFCIGQDLVWEAKATHLHILPFLERSYHLSGRLERKIAKNMRISFGLEGERLFVNASVHDGEYWLTKTPIFLGLNLANSLLNPTKGLNFEYRAIPTLIVAPDRRSFVTQEFSLSHYLPADSEHILTFAQKLSGGFILSGAEGSVPVPQRFFGGSEEDLRGYAYYSVSPLSKKGKPKGGRSAIYYTFETRLRLSKTLGLVPFFDMGNVTDKRFFSPEDKWLKSAGIGLRYFSFVGPFRLDLGFPLNPRKGLDKKYRILISVGQAF